MERWASLRSTVDAAVAVVAGSRSGSGEQVREERARERASELGACARGSATMSRMRARLARAVIYKRASLSMSLVVLACAMGPLLASERAAFEPTSSVHCVCAFVSECVCDIVRKLTLYSSARQKCALLCVVVAALSAAAHSLQLRRPPWQQWQ